MKMLIDVPDYIYSYAIHYRYSEDDMHKVMKAVANGAPILPENATDVTEKWVTATQNANALEKAYKKGYYDALQICGGD